MKVKKVLVGILIPVMVLAMMPVMGHADGENTVKLGDTVTVSGFNDTELQAALAEYTIEGVDPADVKWTPAEDWSEEPLVCEKEEHYHGWDMTEEDIAQCGLSMGSGGDGVCPYLKDLEDPVQTDPEVANNHNSQNLIKGLLYYHEEHNVMCSLGGNTHDGEFHVHSAACTKAHTHVAYADGMTEGEYCSKPGTMVFTAGSNDPADYPGNGENPGNGNGNGGGEDPGNGNGNGDGEDPGNGNGDGIGDGNDELKPNGDGTYSDDANGDGIFGGKGDNTYVSNGEGIFVLQSGSETPETGDTAQIALWIGLLMAAVVGFGAARKVREK